MCSFSMLTQTECAKSACWLTSMECAESACWLTSMECAESACWLTSMECAVSAFRLLIQPTSPIYRDWIVWQVSPLWRHRVTSPRKFRHRPPATPGDKGVTYIQVRVIDWFDLDLDWLDLDLTLPWPWFDLDFVTRWRHRRHTWWRHRKYVISRDTFQTCQGCWTSEAEIRPSMPVKRLSSVLERRR